jgi:hypothetical protein
MKTIDKILHGVNCKYGAPMGRNSDNEDSEYNSENEINENSVNQELNV